MDLELLLARLLEAPLQLVGGHLDSEILLPRIARQGAACLVSTYYIIEIERYDCYIQYIILSEIQYVHYILSH